MPSRLAAVSLAALALLAAGCLTPDALSDDPDGGTDPGDGPGAGDGGDGADGDEELEGYAKPRWSPGLWWTYNVTRGGEEGEVTFAVQAESPEGFTLLADDPDHAALDAVADLAYLGPVRGSDLAGFQGDEPVRFFEWRLTDGRTWTTTWDGAERTHEARLGEVEIVGRSVDGATVTSSAGGEVRASYDFVPGVGWFTRLDLADRDVSYEIAAAGFAYDGNLTRAQAEPGLEAESPAVTVDSFTVPEEAARVGVRIAGAADSLSYDLSLVDPNGTRHAYGPESCQECSADVLDLLPAIPGEWSVQAHLTSDPAGNLTATVSVVTVEQVDVDYSG